MRIREGIEAALKGESFDRPVYLVYDWFVKNCKIDWQYLFDRGLGVLNQATIVECERPSIEIIETETEQDGRVRKDVRWVTAKGELSEWFLDGWRQEYLVKRPEDYDILACGFEDTRFIATDEHFDESERQVGDDGFTLGQMGPMGIGRTPFQEVQIDFAGLERFSLDIGLEDRRLMNLLELMNDKLLDGVRCMVESKAEHVRFWENLSIETMGPGLYRRHLRPVYEKIFEVLEGSGKKVHVHYDGKLNAIKDDIAELPFGGLDSLTPAPEGDVEIAEARRIWGDKFFWMHPSLGWFQKSDEELLDNVRRAIDDAGPSRFCLMISEDVPMDWQRKVPLVLEMLEGF